MANEGLTAGAAARRLGVAVTTLRTWHQRYGLGPNQHIPGHHRRYTADDLHRLEVMRRLTSQGMTPAEAAARARRAAAVPSTAPPEPGRHTDLGTRPPMIDFQRLTTTPVTWRDERAAVSRDGGGHAIAVGRAGRVARGLARAAIRLDVSAMRDILRRAVKRLGVVDAWEHVIMPVLIGVGDRHEATHKLIEVEHLVSRCITEILGSVPQPVTADAPQVLLSCADEEQHSLPMEALAAALAEAGTPSRLLGARVPPTALADAVARTGPTAVAVWAQVRQTAEPRQLTQLLGGAHRPLVVAAAGPGWSRDNLPAEIPTLHSLREAMRVILTAVGTTPVTSELG